MPILDIPILFIMFNRPDHARKVFDRIREVKPMQLFVAVDGPRVANHSDDEQISKCLMLLNDIDWPCEVTTLIRKENLGCGKAVSSAINWFFEQVKMGIILEDDCLPDISFFAYCRNLLIKYEHNNSVMHIGGTNYQDGQKRGHASYYFTKICHVWGWATWRRAWNLYDFSMDNFPLFRKENVIKQLFTDSEDQAYWLSAFQDTYDRHIDTWDYQWVYAVWINNALSVLPNVNLVSNIGFDHLATHTKTKHSFYANQMTVCLQQIVHPTFVLEDNNATEYSLIQQFRLKKGWRRKIERIRLRIHYKTWKL